jgi:hypothetical protein
VDTLDDPSVMREGAVVGFEGQARYPGDAASGWFDAGNQQSYAGTQHIFGSTWKNVDLRHLIFTERSGRYVQLGGLQDGDHNTVIRDRDGTLAGYQVTGAVAGDERYPFVLNNIPSTARPTPGTSATRRRTSIRSGSTSRGIRSRLGHRVSSVPTASPRSC